MKKSDFYIKVILYILIVLIPLFIGGLMMIILADGAGMVFGGIVFWGVCIYFGIRLYHFIKENKDMLI